MLILTLLSVTFALLIFLYFKELFVLARKFKIFITPYIKKNKRLLIAIGLFLFLAVSFSLLIKYNNITKKIVIELNFFWLDVYEVFNPILSNSQRKVFAFYLDLMLVIIISILLVSVFAGILILSFLFKRNLYVLTAIMLIGLLFIVIVNWFFYEEFKLLRYFLLKLLFLSLRKPEKFLRKVRNFIKTMFFYFTFNYYTFIIEYPFFAKLLGEILNAILISSLVILFWFFFLLFALLVLGLFMIRITFYGLIFLTVFLVAYFFLL